ncbi:hypothetical protein V6N13_096550 [Hibiscus sabdariffa]|uniref:Uncharacterized protein n=1 Tax=Hibiscus sabdariffa TaxID=183260 RepID=A0ABR2DH21_9ROSI
MMEIQVLQRCGGHLAHVNQRKCQALDCFNTKKLEHFTDGKMEDGREERDYKSIIGGFNLKSDRQPLNRSAEGEYGLRMVAADTAWWPFDEEGVGGWD